MYVLTAQEIRDWDQFTMEQEPVSSLDLMERAAYKCTEWLGQRNWQNRSFKIFCGKGNNGGDGLAIARMLLTNGYSLSVYILEFGKPGSDDFQANLQRLIQPGIADIHYIQSREHFPLVNTNDILIDALFGSGLNKPLKDLAAELVQHINHSKAHVVSIDLPSGLFIDRSSKENTIIEADETLTFQTYKTALMMGENAPYIGEVHVLDIGLHPGFILSRNFSQQLVLDSYASQIYRRRNAFAHKGHFGHALLVAGSKGKMGAAVLAAKACLRSGVGLLTCYLPECGYAIMQTAVPEAMVKTGTSNEIVAGLPGEIEQYPVIGLGPGLGTAEDTIKLIAFIIRRYHYPLVIDADGLNCLALQKELLEQLPKNSILTPHPKEFDRLFGDHSDDFARMEAARQKAMELNLVIVLKGHHTITATPEGRIFFNSTGNAGMAKGGSGDVLTGMITALVAQHYEPAAAAILGVYLHGLAGDFAADAFSQEAMIAGDIIDSLSQAFLQMRQ